MTRYWYLIDNNGYRRIHVTDENWDFWDEFRSSDAQGPWPAFTQLALRGEPGDVAQALHGFADEHGLICREVTDHPGQWDGALCLARYEQWTLAAEPGLDIEERYVAPLIAEELVASLQTDGAFYGRDPAAGTLMLTLFSDGEPDFEWRDSLMPGPSQALTFHGDGTATDEDPRRFALRRMGLPERNPMLDRYAFIEHELSRLGIDRIQPDLEHVPIEAAFRLDVESSAAG